MGYGVQFISYTCAHIAIWDNLLEYIVLIKITIWFHLKLPFRKCLEIIVSLKNRKIVCSSATTQSPRSLFLFNIRDHCDHHNHCPSSSSVITGNRYFQFFINCSSRTSFQRIFLHFWRLFFMENYGKSVVASCDGQYIVVCDVLHSSDVDESILMLREC